MCGVRADVECKQTNETKVRHEGVQDEIRLCQLLELSRVVCSVASVSLCCVGCTAWAEGESYTI